MMSVTQTFTHLLFVLCLIPPYELQILDDWRWFREVLSLLHATH